MNLSGCTWNQIGIWERTGPSRGIVQKDEPHERNPCTPGFEEQPLEETSRQENCSREAAQDLAISVHELKTTFYSPVELRASTLISEKKNRRAHGCS